MPIIDGISERVNVEIIIGSSFQDRCWIVHGRRGWIITESKIRMAFCTWFFSLAFMCLYMLIKKKQYRILMPLDFFAPMDGGSAGTARTLFFFGGRRTLGAVERPNECGYLFASLVGIEHHKY